MPGVAGVALGAHAHTLRPHTFNAKAMPVFLVMTRAAIHILRTSLFHVGLVHNAGMTIHAEDFTVMNRILIFPDRYVKRTFPTPFTVAIQALIRFVSEQAGGH